MTPRLALSDIADAIGAEVRRDGPFAAPGFLSSVQDATLVSLYDARFVGAMMANPRITAVLASPEVAPEIPETLALAVVEAPLEALFQVHALLLARPGHYWRDFETEIAPDAEVHPRAYVAERNVRIGARSRIGPNATILEYTLIGEDVVVWSGATIGADGFEARSLGGRMSVVPHAGGVRLGDGVHVQANSVIDRALFGGFTDIAEQVMIGSMVNVAHNVRIGPRARIVDSAMLAGSATIGADCWIAPGAVVGAGISVGEGTSVGAQSFVKTDLPAGVIAWGTPAKVGRAK